MIGIDDALKLLGAGVVAGIVGTAGGITSLVSYPALLWVGVAPLPASIANTVALVACFPGSAITSGPELRGRRSWLTRWSVVTVAGGVVGAVLLLNTPARDFAHIVAPLLIVAAVGLLAQPRLTEWQMRRMQSGRGDLLLPVGMFLVAVYNGYFGAGAGVMLLTLLMLTVDSHLARANALKNILVGVATLVSATAFVIFAHVRWSDVWVLALGMFVGSMIGPLVARRLPAVVLRVAAAAMGIGLAIHLWWGS